MPETTETQATGETSSPEAVATSSDTRSSTQDTGTEEQGKETTRQENRIPQGRFNEVIAERDTYKGEIEALRQQVAEREEQQSKLVGLLDAQKEDVTLVSNLRNLAATTEDQSVKDSIDLLDAELTGTREVIENVADEKVAEGALTEAQRKEYVDDRTAVLEDTIAEERAQRLFESANSKAERMLAGLPEEYNDDDKRHLSKTWIHGVDWDGMEESPDDMDNFLAVSLEQELESYGAPRGGMRSAAETEAVTEDGEPIPRDPTPEEEIETLNSIDWSEMKDGKPVHSDEVFSAGVAEAIRAERRRSS